MLYFALEHPISVTLAQVLSEALPVVPLSLVALGTCLLDPCIYIKCKNKQTFSRWLSNIRLCGQWWRNLIWKEVVLFGKAFHYWTNMTPSSCRLLGFTWRAEMLTCSSFHICSMGFRSGDRARQSMGTMPSLTLYSRIIRAVKRKHPANIILYPNQITPLAYWKYTVEKKHSCYTIETRESRYCVPAPRQILRIWIYLRPKPIPTYNISFFNTMYVIPL